MPPSWDDWFAMLKLSEHRAFNYYVNDNGTRKFFGESEFDYSTDVLSKETQTFIDASVGAGKPFFAYVAPLPPHESPIPAPRHVGAFDGEKAPRSLSFNEEDVDDKPPSIQSLPLLSPSRIAQIDAHHERRVESLQSVDELVEAVVGKLQSNGVLDNTYVMLTSDNGFHQGEHRIKMGKGTPYEESIRVPPIVRGPVVQAGTTTNRLTLNTDFLPTFTDLAGVTTPEYVDGHSLRPILEGSTRSWRSAFLLEQGPLLGIRTSSGKKKYIENGDGFKELYDLQADPNELNNFYNASSSPVDLASRLQALKGCAGATCRAHEWDTKVISTIPKANATAVAPTANIKATFSEDMMASSINGTTFKFLERGSTTKIAATVGYQPSTDTATLVPTNSLQSGVTYKAVVSTGAKDVAGNPLDQNTTTAGLQLKAWLFTVG